jgi:hypothetical protein
MSASKTPRTLQELDARLVQAEAMEKLLRELRRLFQASDDPDDPYWANEIDTVIGAG